MTVNGNQLNVRNRDNSGAGHGWPGSEFRETWLGDVYSTASPQTYASLGWTPVSTTAPTVRAMEVSPALLTDGRLNLAFGTNTAVNFAVLHLQVQKMQPSTSTLTPEAAAYVTGGVNTSTNYGKETTFVTKEDSDPDFDRETYLRWDLSGIGPTTRPGTCGVFISVGLRDGTPRIALSLTGDDGQRRYRLGTVKLQEPVKGGNSAPE